MPRYEVIIHHKVGSQFIVEDGQAESELAAGEIANRRYTELGEDGDSVLYDEIEEVEVREI